MKYHIVVPPNVSPGGEFQASINGVLTLVTCPPGSRPGSTVMVEVPASSKSPKTAVTTKKDSEAKAAKKAKRETREAEGEAHRMTTQEPSSQEFFVIDILDDGMKHSSKTKMDGDKEEKQTTTMVEGGDGLKRSSKLDADKQDKQTHVDELLAKESKPKSEGSGESKKKRKEKKKFAETGEEGAVESVSWLKNKRDVSSDLDTDQAQAPQATTAQQSTEQKEETGIALVEMKAKTEALEEMLERVNEEKVELDNAQVAMAKQVEELTLLAEAKHREVAAMVEAHSATQVQMEILKKELDEAQYQCIEKESTKVANALVLAPEQSPRQNQTSIENVDGPKPDVEETEGIDFAKMMKSLGLKSSFKQEVMQDGAFTFFTGQTAIALVALASIGNGGEFGFVLATYIIMEVLFILSAMAIVEKALRQWVYMEAMKAGVLIDFQNVNEYNNFGTFLAVLMAIITLIAMKPWAPLTNQDVSGAITSLFAFGVVVFQLKSMTKPYANVNAMESNLVSLNKVMENNPALARKFLGCLKVQHEYFFLHNIDVYRDKQIDAIKQWKKNNPGVKLKSTDPNNRNFPAELRDTLNEHAFDWNAHLIVPHEEGAVGPKNWRVVKLERNVESQLDKCLWGRFFPYVHILLKVDKVHFKDPKQNNFMNNLARLYIVYILVLGGLFISQMAFAFSGGTQCQREQVGLD